MYVERYNSTCDIFFGFERRMRKEETEERFNEEAKRVRGRRLQGRMDCKHTSGGVFVAQVLLLSGRSRPIYSWRRRKNRWVSEAACGVLPCTSDTQKDGHRGMRR